MKFLAEKIGELHKNLENIADELRSYTSSFPEEFELFQGKVQKDQEELNQKFDEFWGI